jgi:hypothetical protein
MDTHNLNPPMFPMQPEFERIARIGKIRIVHQGGETIGELIPSQRPQEKLFGARIEVIYPTVYDPRTEPPPIGWFAPVGHIPVTIYNLPLEWLQKIETTGDPDIPYQLKL